MLWAFQKITSSESGLRWNFVTRFPYKHPVLFNHHTHAATTILGGRDIGLDRQECMLCIAHKDKLPRRFELISLTNMIYIVPLTPLAPSTSSFQPETHPHLSHSLSHTQSLPSLLSFPPSDQHCLRTHHIFRFSPSPKANFHFQSLQHHLASLKARAESCLCKSLCTALMLACACSFDISTGFLPIEQRRRSSGC